MSTSWKAVCLKCEKVSPNPHPNYTPIKIQDLYEFIWTHHASCGGSFQYINEYQVGYEQVCDRGYIHYVEDGLQE